MNYMKQLITFLFCKMSMFSKVALKLSKMAGVKITAVLLRVIKTKYHLLTLKVKLCNKIIRNNAYLTPSEAKDN